MEPKKTHMNIKLVDSVRAADLKGVIFALGEGADVNYCDYGWTALMSATVARQNRIIYVLLQAGADMNYRCENGWTALALAVTKGYSEIVDVLLQAGVDVNVKNNDGKTALDIATEKGSSDIIKLIKSHTEKQIEQQLHTFGLNI